MVKASVVNIAGAAPQASDKFFVDTNIWKFQNYSKAAFGNQAQKTAPYTNFLAACASVGATLYRSVLSFAELSSIIERTEWDIYKQLHGSVSMKQFREGTKERQDVAQEVQAAWGPVEALSTPLVLTLDHAMEKQAFQNFVDYPLDGYDVFFIEQMRAAKLANIITDDVDYIYVPGLTVYTLNKDSIGRARLFKKLLNP